MLKRQERQQGELYYFNFVFCELIIEELENNEIIEMGPISNDDFSMIVRHLPNNQNK